MSTTLISLEDAADRLAVDTRTVRRFVASGQLGAFRVGSRLIRVRASDVDALLVPIPAGQSR